jgi:hypothetical protein
MDSDTERLSMSDARQAPYSKAGAIYKSKTSRSPLARETHTVM